jgi:ParB-like chromosome segregation protein Spo0J
MNRKVKVEDIRPNPFQARRNFDPESIKSLADEIGKIGLWAGALRGRDHEGHVELCFGHRRFEAVKLLGWEEVDVDVVKLSDTDMALQGLIENLQREGLNDAERGDGIAAYIKLRTGFDDLSPFMGSQSHRPERDLENFRMFSNAKNELATLLGLSASRMNTLLQIASWDEAKKGPIREGQIAGGTALAMDRLAGPEGVKAAAEKGLSYQTTTRIAEEVNKIEDSETKEKVLEKIRKGQIATAEAVVTSTKQFKARAFYKQDTPPDLINVMREWTERATHWAKQLEEVAPYIEYIDREPIVAKRWREAASALVEAIGRQVPAEALESWLRTLADRLGYDLIRRA